MLYTMLCGFWAISHACAFQGLLMLFAAILLPVIALSEVGGISGLIMGLQANGDAMETKYVTHSAF